MRIQQFLPAFLAACSVTLLTWHCSTPEQPYTPPDLAAQQAYYPVQTGRYLEYRVDSIVFDYGPGGLTFRDSSQTLVREETVDTFRDNAGQLLYRLEQFERPDMDQPWTLKRVLSAARTGSHAIRTENNLRFLKLVFPLGTSTNWDGNLWIDQYQEVEIAGERIRPFVNWQYRVDDLDIPLSIGDFVFDSVLVVTEVDETNAVERRFSRSWYAKHIGLVQREQWILDSQYCNQIPPPDDCQTKPWAEKAETGYILRQTITGFN